MISQKDPSRDEISHLAYSLYLQRGAEQGRDVEDWIQAEAQLLQQLKVEQKPKSATVRSN